MLTDDEIRVLRLAVDGALRWNGRGDWTAPDGEDVTDALQSLYERGHVDVARCGAISLASVEAGRALGFEYEGDKP